MFVETSMNKEVEWIRGKMEYMVDKEMLIYSFAVKTALVKTVIISESVGNWDLGSCTLFVSNL